jgi:hypothetical protein
MAVVSVLPISPRTCRYICPSTQPTNSELTIPRRPNQCRPLTISPSFHPLLLLPPTTSHTPLPLSSPHTPASPPSPPQRPTHHATYPLNPKPTMPWRPPHTLPSGVARYPNAQCAKSPRLPTPLEHRIPCTPTYPASQHLRNARTQYLRRDPDRNSPLAYRV